MNKIGHRSTRILQGITAAFLLSGIAACNQTAPMQATSSAPSGSNPQATSAFSQFPDIPVPAGAKMNVDKTLVFGSDPWFGQLALNTSSNAGLIFNFFRQNLTEHDWQEVTSVRAPTSILTYMREDRVLAISIQGSTLGGSDITITVSPRGTPKAPVQGMAPAGDLMPIPVTKTP